MTGVKPVNSLQPAASAVEKWPHLPVEGVASGDHRKPSQKDTGIGTIAALAHVKAPIQMGT